MEGYKHFTQLIISASLLEQENEALSKEVKELNDIKNGMECGINNLREQNKKLHALKEEFKDENDGLKNENGDLMEENEKLGDENEKLVDENEKLTLDIKSLKEENLNLKDANGLMTKERLELVARIADLEKENKEAKDAIEKLKSTGEIKESYIANLLKEIEKLRGLTCFRAVCKNRQAQKSAAVGEDGNGKEIAEQ